MKTISYLGQIDRRDGKAMGQLFATAIALIVVVIVGFAVVPMVGGLIASIVVLAFTWISRLVANLVGRYGGFFVTAYAFAIGIAWANAYFHLVSWILWTAYALLMLSGFNTLLSFDVRCFRSRSGAWFDD